MGEKRGSAAAVVAMLLLFVIVLLVLAMWGYLDLGGAAEHAENLAENAAGGVGP